MCRLKGSISWVCLMAICITPYTLTSMALRVFCMPYPPPIPFMGFKTRLVSSPPIKSPTPSKPLSPIDSQTTPNISGIALPPINSQGLSSRSRPRR